MLFDTPGYGVFLILVFYLHGFARSRSPLRPYLLLAASYFFYMCWNPLYLGLILFSTALDFAIGRALHAESREGRRKMLLVASLVGNLGVLGVFKYSGFFSRNVNVVAAWLGMGPLLPILDVLLPVGISFYTFQTLSYTIEIYQRRLEPRKSLAEFALFVSFFPQLVAGPIVRASHFLPQLDKPREPGDRQIASGLFLVLKGLFKKIVIADTVGMLLVREVYADPSAHGALAILLATYAFRVQIYCDFSGYSDIAIGSARMLGYDLPVNFREPYKATSVRDYWRRWHISMGSWFRDFVFFPLCSRGHKGYRGYMNLMITMGVVGLWHGAQWTFVIWGLYYGTLLCLDRAWRKLRKRPMKEPTGIRRIVAILLVFQLNVGASVIFRAQSLSDVGVLFGNLFSTRGWNLDASPTGLVAMAIGFVLIYLPLRFKERCEIRFVRAGAIVQALVVAALLALFLTLKLEDNPFYYFQF